MMLLLSSYGYAQNGPAGQDVKNPGFLDLRYQRSAKLIYPDNLSNSTQEEGLHYNKNTNTLTLTNFKSSEYGLICGNMGDDFKIRLVGDNELSYLTYLSESDYNTNLTIKGSGSLVVNRNRNSNGIYGLSEIYKLPMKLTIKKSARVTAYCGTDNDSFSVKFQNVSSKPILKVNGSKKIKLKKSNETAGNQENVTSYTLTTTYGL